LAAHVGLEQDQRRGQVAERCLTHGQRQQGGRIFAFTAGYVGQLEAGCGAVAAGGAGRAQQQASLGVGAGLGGVGQAQAFFQLVAGAGQQAGRDGAGVGAHAHQPPEGASRGRADGDQVT
jgi:hypothetical protein